MSNYRKIYELAYGAIPKDEDGRTYEIHHIDGRHSNDSPENLKAVSIQEHYELHYAQCDWNACLRMAERMKLSPSEISSLATEQNLKRIADGTHIFIGDKNPGPAHSRRRVAEKTHQFLGGKIQRQTQQKLVKNGLNNFQIRPDGSSISSDKVANGTHNLLGSDANRKMLESGTHASQKKKFCLYCVGEYDSPNFSRWHGAKCKDNNGK